MKRLRRILLFLGGTVVIVGILGYFGLSAIVYNAVTATNTLCTDWDYTPAAYTIPESELGAEPITPHLMPDYQEVSFPSLGDPLTLSGWYIPAAENPEASDVIILVHTWAMCKKAPNMLFTAGMLHQAGFSTLLIDLRDHGNSEIEDGHFAAGTDEYRDVLGAWDWLVTEKQVPPERIGLFGASLGAATSLIAFGEEPRIAAIWADSSYAEVEVAIRDELTRMGLPTFIASTARMMGNLIAGDDIGSKSPLLAIATAGNRPVFITHGTADTRLSVQYATDLLNGAQAAGATNVQSWIVEGSTHVSAMFDQPAEYEERLVAFFQMALG